MSATSGPSLPLRLPDAPFDLGEARLAAQLLRGAYKLTRAWEAAGKPAPEDFSWAPDADLEGVELGPPLWASARDFGPFERHQPFGFVARTEGLAYLVFRGTETPADLITNLRLAQVDYPFVEDFGRVHGGFCELYTALRPAVHEELARVGARALVVAGHSMGAGLSSIAFPDLCRNVESLAGRARHYCYGSPRVGNPGFAAAIHGLISSDASEAAWGRSYRLNNTADPVVVLPPAIRDKLVGEDVLYQHCGVGIELCANYGSAAVNHSLSRTYLYAVEHPEQPCNPDA